VIDEVRSAYTALRTQQAPAGPDLSVLALASVAGAYAGVDELRRQHLLLAIETESSPQVGIATLAIGTRVLSIGGNERVFLDVTCLFEALAEVFDHFVSAVLEQQRETGEDATAVVSSVIERWREFLVASSAPPGRDKLAAVLGELLVVLDVVENSGPSGIDAWVGPFGGRHDMRGGLNAVEVKTTRAHTSHQVTIHGEDQLLAPESGRLYLHFIRLEQVPGGGRTVSSVVDELLTAGVAVEPLFEAIAAAGVPLAQLAATNSVAFDVRERLTLPVDDRMPKIVPASFSAGRRPAGVVDVSYVIDLDQCLESALPELAYSDLLKKIGAQGAA
jgi:hypothetical protein